MVPRSIHLERALVLFDTDDAEVFRPDLLNSGVNRPARLLNGSSPTDLRLLRLYTVPVTIWGYFLNREWKLLNSHLR